MKITSIIQEDIKKNKILWNNKPKIGWIYESNFIKLYYGATKNQIKRIFEEGIIADSSGFVKCSLEPNTAIPHAKIRYLYEGIKNPFLEQVIVFRIKYPIKEFKQNGIIDNDLKNHLKDKKIYEHWAKSDVEYYSFITIKIPKHVPINYINGYMVK